MMTTRNTREPGLGLGGGAAIRVQFISAFVGAATGSLVFSSLGYSWLPAVWAGACMLVYWALARYRAPEHAETEEFADNYYYLGFLLTLVSLFGVLVSLGRSASAGFNDDILRTVLSQFGLALITTIIGLVGRTLMLMFGTTAQDIEERAETRMNRAFDEFTRSLNRLTAEATAFSQGFGAQLRTCLTNVERSVDEFGTIVQMTSDNLKPVHAAFANVSSGFDASIGGIRSSTNALVEELTASKSELHSTFSAFGESVGGASTEISSYAAGIKDIIDEAARGARQPLDRVQATAAAFDREVGDVTATLSRLPQQVSGTYDQTEASVRRLESDLTALGQSVREFKEAVSSIVQAMNPDNMGVSQSVESLRAQVDRLAAIHAQLAEEAEGSSKAVIQIRREMAAGVDFFLHALQPDNADRNAGG